MVPPINTGRDGLLDQRDQEVLLQAASPKRRWSPRSEGNSPRRWSPGHWSPPKWSPSKLSPSSSGSPFHRNNKKYSELEGGSSFDNEDQENSVPLAELSVEHTGGPTVAAAFNSAYHSPALKKESSSSAMRLQQPHLPSPSPKPRFAMSTMRQRGLKAQPLSPPSKKTDPAPASPSVAAAKNHPTSPIFRFKLQTSPHGTEMILPGVSGMEEDRNEEDDFDILVKERQGSVRDAMAKERQKFSDTELPSPPGIQSSRHLHELCASISTLDDLLRAQTFLKGHYSYASKVDMQGRTPLHILSCNKVLATAVGVPKEFDVETREFLRVNMQLTHDPESNQLEKHVLRFLVGDLLPAHPGAMMLRDDQSMIPFQKALTEWVKETHQRGISNDAGATSASAFSYSGAVSNMWESTIKMAGRTSQMIAGGFAQAASPTTREANGMERGDSRSAIFSPDTNRREQYTGTHTPGKAVDDTRDGVFPGFVRLTPQARFTLTMLSAALDQLERYQSPALLRRSLARPDATNENFIKAHEGLKEFQRQYGSVNIVSSVVETLASIPDLMVTILLIDSDSDRDFALSTSVIRRIMLSKNSVGPWLTKILQTRDRQLAQRAVDYLKTVSNELGKQKSSPDGNPSKPNDIARDHFVVDAVSRLQDFVPSLLALNERGIEDASTTLIVKQVLGRMISRPFAVTVILCDMLFLAMMIIGFRFAVNRLIEGASLDKVLQWIYIANTGIFYFIIREIGKTVSLFLISTRARSYFLSFWNLIDALTVMLALASSIVMRSYFSILVDGMEDTAFLRGLLAITTGFLWLRVLSLLKAINIQLATFVLAILQITKDILWFAVILATLVVAFSQMFFTLLAPASCAADDGTDAACKPTEYLLQVYTILLGDFGSFQREQFTSGFSVFLVVLYSFLVTVVLLNVLIAIASDSYEKCLLRSQHLFGRARVMLIAELVAFQNLLQTTGPWDDSGTKQDLYSSWRSPGRWIRHWSRASILFFSLSVLVIFAWTISELLGYTTGEQPGNIAFSLASVIVNVGLFAIIMFFLAAASKNRNIPHSTGPEDKEGPLQGAMLRLLGVSRNPDHFNKDDDEWNGQVNYLERQMRRIADEQRFLAGQQVKTMENLVNQTELRLKAELEVMEDNFITLREVLLHEVQGTKRTNQYVTIAVQELKNLISTATSTAYRGTPVPSEVNVDRNTAVNPERRDG